MTSEAQSLLEHGLKDMYDAEQRFAAALSTMRQNAHDPSLADGFERHREVTLHQVERLARVFDEIGSRARREECPAARGLVREYEKFVEAEGTNGAHDAFAATAGLKVEHYEIASYRALIDLAEFCGFGGAARLLKQNLAEEEQAAAEMQSAATKLSAELAGASIAEVAGRSFGAIVDQAREGTLAAVGGARAVGERAVARAKSVVRSAESRGRSKMKQTRGSASGATSRSGVRKASSPSRTTSRKTTTASNAKKKATTRGASKVGGAKTRNASRPRSNSAGSGSRTTSRRTTRPSARKSSARSTTRRRGTTTRRRGPR